MQRVEDLALEGLGGGSLLFALVARPRDEEERAEDGLGSGVEALLDVFDGGEEELGE